MRTTKLLATLTAMLTLSCAGRSMSAEMQAFTPSGVPAGTTAESNEPASVCDAAPRPIRHAADEGCAEAPAPAELQSKLFHQLRYHQTFPASRAQVLAALRAAAELDAIETAYVADRLPLLRFASGADVMLAVFPAAPAAGLALLAGPTTLAQR